MVVWEGPPSRRTLTSSSSPLPPLHTLSEQTPHWFDLGHLPSVQLRLSLLLDSSGSPYGRIFRLLGRCWCYFSW